MKNVILGEPMLHVLKKLLSAGVLLILLLSAVPFTAEAASLSTTRVSTTGGGTITMAPGESKNITVTFQNTGTTTWKNDGPGYISLYTYDPKYRTSSFDPGTWLSPSQVKRLSEASVVPMATGTISFQIHAPSTEGTYKEGFNLASEDAAWIPGGAFALNITVKKSSSASASGTSTTTPESTVSSTTGYTASLVTQTANSLQVKAGKTIAFTAMFKNTGTTTWSSYGIKAPDVSLASTSSVSFAHSSWSGNQLALLTGQSVKPGDTAVVQFVFTAPKTNGTHTAKFQLTANDIAIPDAFVEIPVTVTGGAPAALNSPVVEEDTTSYIDEDRKSVV